MHTLQNNAQAKRANETCSPSVKAECASDRSPKPQGGGFTAPRVSCKFQIWLRRWQSPNPPTNLEVARATTCTEV
eukprot:13961771-Alexandrium_andersonii.AAC.1